MCSVMCAMMMDCSKTLRLSSFDRGCPRAHVDVQVPPWCLPGASLVPPRCLLGASSVHPWCILGPSLVPPWCLLAPLDLVPAPSVDTKNPRGFSFKFTMCPVPPPKMPPKPPMLLHNPSSARFSDPQIHQKCPLVTPTRGKGGDSFTSGFPFFHFTGGMGPKLYQLLPTALFPLPM